MALSRDRLWIDGLYADVETARAAAEWEELSILYLRCRRRGLTREAAAVATFNSLFEMPM